MRISSSSLPPQCPAVSVHVLLCVFPVQSPPSFSRSLPPPSQPGNGPWDAGRTGQRQDPSPQEEDMWSWNPAKLSTYIPLELMHREWNFYGAKFAPCPEMFCYFFFSLSHRIWLFDLYKNGGGIKSCWITHGTGKTTWNKHRVKIIFCFLIFKFLFNLSFFEGFLRFSRQLPGFCIQHHGQRFCLGHMRFSIIELNSAVDTWVCNNGKDFQKLCVCAVREK